MPSQVTHEVLLICTWLYICLSLRSTEHQHCTVQSQGGKASICILISQNSNRIVTVVEIYIFAKQAQPRSICWLVPNLVPVCTVKNTKRSWCLRAIIVKCSLEVQHTHLSLILKS